jgi:hypothetical protein
LYAGWPVSVHVQSRSVLYLAYEPKTNEFKAAPMAQVFGAINSLIKACELAFKLSEVSEESAVFLRTILRVRDDITETERLLSCLQVKAHLERLPEKRKWIKDTIVDTKKSMNEIGKYVERARNEKDREGTISLTTRWQWVLSAHDKLDNRREELSACHRSLGNILNFLIPLEGDRSPASISSSDEPPPAYNSGSSTYFANPQMWRKMRRRYLSSEGEIKLTSMHIALYTIDLTNRLLDLSNPSQISILSSQTSPGQEEIIAFTASVPTHLPDQIKQTMLTKELASQSTPALGAAQSDVNRDTSQASKALQPTLTSSPGKSFPNLELIPPPQFPSQNLDSEDVPSDYGMNTPDSAEFPVEEIKTTPNARASNIPASVDEVSRPKSTSEYRVPENVQIEMSSTVGRSVTSVNPHGPVDPFSLYAELPSNEVRPSVTGLDRVLPPVELSRPLSTDDSLQQYIEVGPSATALDRVLPSVEPSPPLSTDNSLQQYMCKPQLPATLGYTIHELPAAELSRPRESIAEGSSVSSLQSQKDLSPWNTRYSTSTYQSNTNIAESSGPYNSNITNSSFYQRSSLDAMVKLAQNHDAGVNSDAQQSWRHRSTLPFTHQLSSMSQPNLNMHASTYPPPIPPKIPYSELSLQNQLPHEMYAPPMSQTNASSSLYQQDSYTSALSFATTSDPGHYFDAGSRPLQSPPTINTPQGISPGSSGTSLTPPTDPSAGWTPEAKIRHRRKALRYAVIGDI